VVLTPTLALAFVSSEFFMSSADEKYWEVAFYWYIFTVILLHAAWWWFVCSLLRGATCNVSANFYKLDMFSKVSVFRQSSDNCT
jgi:hypothetical protein